MSKALGSQGGVVLGPAPVRAHLIDAARSFIFDTGLLFPTLTLRPVYKDAFQAEGLGLVRFRRDTSGRVIGFSVTMDRVWDLRFDRKQ